MTSFFNAKRSKEDLLVRKRNGNPLNKPRS